MTIGDVIDQCNRIRPNQYTKPDMLRWLSEVDGRIFTEIWCAHVEAADGPFTGYDENTPDNTELLAVCMRIICAPWWITTTPSTPDIITA